MTDGACGSLVPTTCVFLGYKFGRAANRVAILPPGAHHAIRRGATKGLITCHLGLVVPRDGDVRMRVGDRVVRWSEGETLVFDDTYDHEVWNEASGTRIVLRIRFDRPLRNPGKWVADRVRRLPGLRAADEA